MNKQDIQLLYEYNRWANAQVLNVSSKQTEDQFTNQLGCHRELGRIEVVREG